MTNRLKDVLVTSDEFARVFEEFTEHTDTDRWPVHHPDEAARNLRARVPVAETHSYRATCCVQVTADRVPTPQTTWHHLAEQPHVPGWAAVRARLEAEPVLPYYPNRQSCQNRTPRITVW